MPRVRGGHRRETRARARTRRDRLIQTQIPKTGSSPMRSAIDALDAAALSGTASCASKTARIVFTTHGVDPLRRQVVSAPAINVSALSPNKRVARIGAFYSRQAKRRAKGTSAKALGPRRIQCPSVSGRARPMSNGRERIIPSPYGSDLASSSSRIRTSERY